MRVELSDGMSARHINLLSYAVDDDGDDHINRTACAICENGKRMGKLPETAGRKVTGTKVWQTLCQPDC